MAINETAKVKMRFEADTKPARREIDKLTAKQKRSAQATVAASKAQQQSIAATTAAFGKLAIGVGSVLVAFKGLNSAAKEYAKQAQLEAAASGLNAKRIQAAARGLITEYEALSFAAAQANTDFKLSQGEMEEVAKFMIVLRNQGNDLTAVYDGVTKALVEGNVRGLRRFGIVLHAASGKADAHAKIMARIREENEKAGDAIEIAGDKAIRAANTFDDAMRDLKKSIGEVAIALSPVVEFIGGLVDSVTAMVEQLKAIGQLDIIKLAAMRAESISPGLGAAVERGWEKEKDRLMGREFASSMVRMGETMAGGFLAKVAGEVFFGGPPKRAEPGGTGKGSPVSFLGPEHERGDMALDPGFALQRERERLGSGPGPYRAPDVPGFDFDPTKLDAMTEAMKTARSEAELLSATFDMMGSVIQSSATASFQAYVDGSKSAKEALKDFIGDALSGIASQLAALSIAQLAEGWAKLSNPYTAGLATFNFKAAALAAAGAVTVGAMAQVWGGSGKGTVTGGGSANPGGAGAVTGGGGGGSHVTVFVGSDFEDNARANANRLSRAFARVRRTEGDDDVVVYQ